MHANYDNLNAGVTADIKIIYIMSQGLRVFKQ